MSFSRYIRDNNIGGQLGTAKAIPLLRSLIKNGNISIRSQVIANGNDRLDTLAGSIYGDAKYWWVLAAASEIGWGLQIPPGTVINILDLRDVERLVG
jgi:nucleoid-associated protein YgaU